MITKKLLLTAIAATGLAFTAVAQEFHVEIGDRPYYTHGSRYWAGEYEMIWVPGHWSHYGHHWVHGHYTRGHHRHHGDRPYYYRDEYR
jgi:hypothetical protein